MPKITHIFFNCDNTLVLSPDPIYVYGRLVYQLLNKKKIQWGRRKVHHDTFRNDYFSGKSFREILTNIQKIYKFEMTPAELDSQCQRAEENVIDMQIRKYAQPCVGVNVELERLSSAKKYDLAVVSSQSLPRVLAGILKCDQSQHFPSDHIFAATTLTAPFIGTSSTLKRDDPAIFLHAMGSLGVEPGNCVAVVESTKEAVLAAKRAGIKEIVHYLDWTTAEDMEEKVTMLREVGALGVVYEWDEFGMMLAKIEAAQEGAEEGAQEGMQEKAQEATQMQEETQMEEATQMEEKTQMEE